MNPKPMSVFAHYVAQCSIAHQKAMRAARGLDPLEHHTTAAKEASRLTVALINRLQRLETLVAEMGAGAVFGTPERPIGMDEVARLFPDE